MSLRRVSTLEVLMLKKKFDKWKVWQNASTNRKIFSAMLVVASMTLVVKIIAAAKEMVVAGYFGTSGVVDAFLIAFLLPTFAINVIAGSFSTAVMPVYTRTREKMGVGAANKLFASVMIIGVILLVIVALLLAVTAPVIVPVLASGFSTEKAELTLSLFYWLLPVLVFTGIGNLYATVMNAGERFAMVALTPAITPLVTVTMLTLLAPEWGVKALVFGVLLGSVLESGVLMSVVARRGLPVLPHWYGLTDEVRKVAGQYAPMVAGAFLMSSTVLVDQTMAAMLDSGSVATLNYANKLTALFLGIGSMALGTAVLPHFSRLVAVSDWRGIRHTLKTYIRLILLITLPVTIALYLFSEPIVALLFERGAFNAADSLLVGQVQAFYVLQISFYVLGILGVRLISAMAKNEILMKIAVVNLLLNIVLNFLLMKWLGVAGIALSTSLVYFVSTTIIFSVLYLNLKNQPEM